MKNYKVVLLIVFLSVLSVLNVKACSNTGMIYKVISTEISNVELEMETILNYRKAPGPIKRDDKRDNDKV